MLNHEFDRQLVFEKAYCEYRQNRPEEALKTIKSAEELDSRLKELLGQVVGHHLNLSIDRESLKLPDICEVDHSIQILA